jgi:hypothetical protein
MNRDTVKVDFASMLRTFSCAQVDIRFKGKEVKGLLSTLSEESRLMRTGIDPDWQASISVGLDDLAPEVIEAQDIIEVRERGESRYTEYRCRKPKNVAQSYYRVDVTSKYRGT